MTRASLIVLNYNGAQVLRDCLKSLQASMGADDELIVVDNNSPDGSADICAEFTDITLVRLPLNTYIFGLNEGLKVASGRFVAFLNNDMTVSDNFVDGCLSVFDDSTFAVCPRIQQGGAEQGSRTRGFLKRGILFYTPLEHVEHSTLCFFAVGGQSFFRREMLDEIGSIDPLLHPMYHEDIELSYRAWKRGWTIRYAPSAVVDHIGGHSSKRVFTPTQLRSFVRQNEFLTVWKNVTDPALLAQHILLLPGRLAIALWRRDWATLLGFAQAAKRLTKVLRARTEAKKHFRLTDRQVLSTVSQIV